MSAVMKETPVELAVIETKSLATMLVLPEKEPSDFFKNPVYLANVKAARELTEKLTYQIDDDGEKLAKADIAKMRRFAKDVNGFAKSIYNKLTENIKGVFVSFTDETKLIENNANKIASQFEARKKEKLEGIRTLLTDELNSLWDAEEVKTEYRKGSIESFVKISGTLTGNKALTKNAKEFIAGIVNNNLAEQRKIEMRTLILSNRCLLEDINPVLTPAHFGTVFYAEESFFNEKLEELVAIEIQRRADLVARIEKQQAEANQKKLDDALKAQQAEADRIAKEKADRDAKNLQAEQRRERDRVEEQLKLEKIKAHDLLGNKIHDKQPESDKPTAQALRDSADRIDQSAQYADRREDRNREMAMATDLRKQADELESASIVTVQHHDSKPVEIRPGKRTVKFTASFEVIVPERVSDRGVEDHFMSKLSDDLKAILKQVSFVRAS